MHMLILIFITLLITHTTFYTIRSFSLYKFLLQIFLHMEFVGLQNLVLDNESWAVKIRICRLWESLNTKRNGELINLDMVVIDENVCHLFLLLIPCNSKLCFG